MRVQVSSASGTVQVELNTQSNVLTAQRARAAREIAFGVGASATVSNGFVAYRVTSKTTRRIR